jgi:nitric oxide reductase activation protein
VIKDYDEGYTSETKARIGGIEQRSVTLLPDAIEVAQKVLAQQAAETRILVVASDGYPTGYKGIENSLVSTVKAVSNSGTFLMGLGIDSHELEEYFTVNCVVSSPAQMMKSFVKSYLELSSMF